MLIVVAQATQPGSQVKHAGVAISGLAISDSEMPTERHRLCTACGKRCRSDDAPFKIVAVLPLDELDGEAVG
jgi:hypothetical protein